LKKELECAEEKSPQVSELIAEVDVHQKVRDLEVKGAPGTKIESMKVYILYFAALVLLH